MWTRCAVAFLAAEAPTCFGASACCARRHECPGLALALPYVQALNTRDGYGLFARYADVREAASGVLCSRAYRCRLRFTMVLGHAAALMLAAPLLVGRPIPTIPTSRSTPLRSPA